MKKNGFTLVELLAVIAILAILVIVAMPNVLGMFNEAKQKTFVTDVQKIMDTAVTEFTNDSFSQSGKTIYYSSVENANLETSKLNIDASGKDYFIEMDRNGQFKRVVVYDDNYCYDIYDDGGNGNVVNTKSKKISVIKKTSVNVSDLWESGNDSIVATVSGKNYEISGCQGLVNVGGKQDDSIEDNNEIQALSKISRKTWSGLNEFDGENIWSDGNNIYYSYESKQYVLKNGVWEQKVWTGLTYFYGSGIWKYNGEIYYSFLSNQYKLEDDKWIVQKWTGLSSFQGTYVWSDGTDVYYSDEIRNKQYKLNGNNWEVMTLDTPSSYYGSGVWSDGVNIYLSYNAKQYVLNDGKWVKKTWGGCNNFLGMNVWTDGVNYYMSNGSAQYVLEGDTWLKKIWSGDYTYLDGSYIWFDGTNYYYSRGSSQYVITN